MLTIYIDTPEQATTYFNPLDWDLSFMDGDNEHIEDWTPITIDEHGICGTDPEDTSKHYLLCCDISWEFALEQAEAQNLTIKEQ